MPSLIIRLCRRRGGIHRPQAGCTLVFHHRSIFCCSSHSCTRCFWSKTPIHREAQQWVQELLEAATSVQLEEWLPEAATSAQLEEWLPEAATSVQLEEWLPEAATSVQLEEEWLPEAAKSAQLEEEFLPEAAKSAQLEELLPEAGTSVRM